MELQKRKLPRLKDFDYSTPGAYFITICTHNKKCIFGRIHPVDALTEAITDLSAIGEIAKHHLLDIESHYDNITLDNWVIMPNHIHMLVHIHERKQFSPTPKFDISNIIGKFKAAVTRSVRKAIQSPPKVWQTSFYDHIVRNENDYQMIWQYIRGNPNKWIEDCFYTD